MIERLDTPLVYIDTNVIADFFEGSPHRAARLKILFGLLELNDRKAATRELSLAELLGKGTPGTAWDAQKKFYAGLLCEKSFIKLYPVTREILFETGELRRSAVPVGRSIKLPVTAYAAGCRCFLASDRRIFIPPPLRLVIADDVGLAEIEAALDA